MNTNNLARNFQGDLTTWFLGQPKVCSPRMQSSSSADSFSHVNRDLKLNHFFITLAKTAINHHFTHETISMDKQEGGWPWDFPWFLLESYMGVIILAGWLAVHSCKNMHFARFCPNFYIEALNCVILGFKHCAVWPLLYLQHYPSASPALPLSPEEPRTVHHSIPVPGLFPTSLTCTSDVVALVYKHFRCAPVYSAPCGAEWKLSLAHHPSNIGMLSLSLTWVSLSLSLRPFKPGWKLFQPAPLICEHKYFSPIEDAESCQGPAGLVSCRASCDWKNPPILPVTPAQRQVLTSCVCLFLLMSLPTT